jgi:hypothetical protein
MLLKKQLLFRQLNFRVVIIELKEKQLWQFVVKILVLP